ncbi:MAG TPA: S8 family serine peptidase [Steroidobacteraceae bacterium]|nr:S8 family serine peptidase [Steroidobacteraceae bacterium]
MRAWLRLLWLALACAAATAAVRALEPAPGSTAAAPKQAALPRIVVAFANEPRSAPGPAGSTGRRYSGDGYRVSQSAESQARRVAAEYALREVASWPIRELAMHCVVYEITSGRPAAEVLAALAHDSRVVLAEALHEFHTLSFPAAAGAPSYNDPLYDLQANLPALGIADAHRRARGAGIRIALIDTAVDTRHPDLAGRIVRSRSFTGTNHGAGGSQRHGTAMAGIIAAVADNHTGIVGIAPLAQLEVFEACWQLAPDSDAAACNTFTLAKALAAALESGVPLVNLSVAGPSDPLLAALVETGVKRGVVFVGATDAGGGFPTAIPGVIGAAGSESDVPPGALAAPARHVLTLRPDAQYDFESGSSVAAAEITGVIALLMSATPSRLSADAILSLLKPTPTTVAVTAAAPAAVNAAAALARLDLERRRTCTASRTSAADAGRCAALAGNSLDGL